MVTVDKITDENLQYDIKREAARNKIDKYEYLPSE